MLRVKFVPLLAGILIVGLIGLAGCGTTTSRKLETITLNPTVADAQDFPNGQVPFTATGHFNKPPATETPLTVGWQVSDSSIATVTSAGVGECIAGKTGMVTVTGFIQEVGLNGNKGGRTEGTAQLQCP